MSHTYSKLLMHIVFSTKRREKFLTTNIRPEVHSYICGILWQLGANTLRIGGVEDHIHALIQIPHRLSTAEIVRVVKCNSTRWIHEKWPHLRTFAWQTGYAAFTVSPSNAPAVISYIANQETHHKKSGFQQEYLRFLKENGISFDSRYT